MRIKRHIYFLFLLALTLGTAVCCTPKINHNVLTFFFDGVPTTNEPEGLDIADSVIHADSSTIALAAIPKKVSLVLHKPYETKDCELCHDKSSMGQLTDSQPSLCYNCHLDFSYEYTNLHGPVDGGYCTNCHNPHSTKTEFLLLREGKDLCLNCHDQSQLYNNKLHFGLEDLLCTECHNPHGGENSGLLIDDQPELCYRCHTDFNEEYDFIHGPVGGGNCTSCHSSHSDQSDHFLLREGQSLCLHCHDSKWVFKNENHEGIEDYNCTECHNPHGGENRYYY